MIRAWGDVFRYVSLPFSATATAPMEPTNLRMLIELAVTSRDAAASRAAQTRDAVAAAQKQLAALEGYAHEYAGRARQQAHAGVDPAAQANARAFDQRLELALTQQRREVERRVALANAAQQEFTEQQRRVKSLETLAERRREAVRQTESRRDQKHLDEIAARSFTLHDAAQAAAQAIARATEHPAPALRW